jgi:hypothetical protein
MHFQTILLTVSALAIAAVQSVPVPGIDPPKSITKPKIVKKATKFKKTVGKNKQNQDPERPNNTLSSPDVPIKIEFDKTPLERQVSGLTEVSEDDGMEFDEFEEGFYSEVEKAIEKDSGSVGTVDDGLMSFMDKNPIF